jgi:hypothetical protein
VASSSRNVGIQEIRVRAIDEFVPIGDFERVGRDAYAGAELDERVAYSHIARVAASGWCATRWSVRPTPVKAVAVEHSPLGHARRGTSYVAARVPRPRPSLSYWHDRGGRFATRRCA